MRSMHCRLRDQNMNLEAEVRARTCELEDAQRDVLERLGLVTEFRDDDTGGHIRRVGDLAGRVAIELGLAADLVERLRLAAPLHDLGKVAIPDEILLKPGKLDPDEFRIVQDHTLIGVRILAGSRSKLLQLAEEIALTHHERWDGQGYPYGLEGEQIPLSGRIIAVVDVFDALTSRRPYKEPWSVSAAMDEIARLSGLHFDPQVVGAFQRVIGAEQAFERLSLAA